MVLQTAASVRGKTHIIFVHVGGNVYLCIIEKRKNAAAIRSIVSIPKNTYSDLIILPSVFMIFLPVFKISSGKNRLFFSYSENDTKSYV